jgi:hypothetical protein
MLFEADSTVDIDDMQHLLGMYSGIAFAGPAASASGSPFRSIIITAGKDI